MTIYAVEYTYDERAAVRDAVRPEHRAFLRTVAEAGALLGSGPWLEGAPGALLVFRAPSRDELDALLAADPFAREGLIARTQVRAWDLVLGPWSASAD